MRPDFYKELLDNLFDGVYFVDHDRKITYWNQGAERISGFSQAEAVGKSCADNLLMHIDENGTQLCLGACPVALTLADGKEREADVFLRHKDGHRVPVKVRVSALRDEHGAIIGAVEIFSHCPSQGRSQQELCEYKQLALSDPLTALGNRRAAGLEFERRHQELCRYNMAFGLLFLDIDGFKRINDTYGHDVGDQVLVMVSRTLESALRGVDKVFRWGGEEFVLVVPRMDEDAFRSVAERVRRFVESTAIDVPGGVLRITASLGGSMASQDDSLESLAARADSMMYQAKQRGGNCVTMDCEAPSNATH